MKKRKYRYALILWGIGATLYMAGQMASVAGLLINDTVSAPRGVWRIEPLTGPVERGQMVSLCPPDDARFRLGRERGYLTYGWCPGGYERMLKMVGAVPGDVVSMTAQGVAVNGRLLDNSAPQARDGSGRVLNAMPQGAYTVAAGEVWLISTYTSVSFDSRYFGPVASAQIEGGARPLWIESQSSLTASVNRIRQQKERSS